MWRRLDGSVNNVGTFYPLSPSQVKGSDDIVDIPYRTKLFTNGGWSHCIQLHKLVSGGYLLSWELKKGFSLRTNHTLKLKTIRTLQYRLRNLLTPSGSGHSFSVRVISKLGHSAVSGKSNPLLAWYAEEIFQLRHGISLSLSSSYRPSKLKQHFSRIC